MIKKIIKISAIVLLSIIIAIVLLGGFLWLKVKYGTEITQIQSFNETQPYIWNKVDLGDHCKCSDGSDYWIYTKKGKSNNLIIHFQGGGACWDDYSCSNPLVLNPFMVYYLPRINEWFFKAQFSKGIMRNDFQENPFKDWNIVYIPYCTADLHIGNAVNSYSVDEHSEKVVRHNGKVNVQNALKWTRNNISNTKKVFITGESAGGFGSIFWTPAIVSLFPEADRYYQLSDCSFIDSEVLLDAVKLWNAEPMETFGLEMGTDIINSALRTAEDKLGDREIIFLQSYSKFDEILIDFVAAINNNTIKNEDNTNAWSNAMLRAVSNNSTTFDNYFYYVTDWNKNKKGKTPHTFIVYNPFYECIEDEIIFKDWLNDCVVEDNPYSVGSIE